MGSGQEATSGIAFAPASFIKRALRVSAGAAFSLSSTGGEDRGDEVDSKTSDDIVFSQRDVNEIPGDVDERRMNFLDSMNTVGRHYEAVISHFREPPAVFAEPRYGEDFSLPRRFQCVDEVGRFATGAHSQCHVAGLAKQFELIDEDARVIQVVAHRGHRADVGHQRNDGERFSLFDYGMGELDAEMKRITQAAAIAHDKQLFARAK